MRKHISASIGTGTVALALALGAAQARADTAGSTVIATSLPNNQFLNTATNPVYWNVPWTMSGGEFDTANLDTMSDGNLNSGWVSGQDQNLNISITAGQVSQDGSTFEQGTFGVINDIKIWTQYVAYAYPNPSSPWEGPVPQVKILYSMTPNTATSGGGWWGNGSTLNGPDTDIWNYTADITAVNGVAVTPDANGFIDLTSFENSSNTGAVTTDFGAFGNSTGTAYPLQLSVYIPAGATSVVFEFGDVIYPGGDFISEIQASAVPEPASLGLLGLGSLALLARRRHAVSR